YQGYCRHVALLQHGATIGAAKLWYDRSKQRFSLLISLQVETPDPTPDQFQRVVGVDVGQRYLATVATTPNRTQFYSGTSDAFATWNGQTVQLARVPDAPMPDLNAASYL